MTEVGAHKDVQLLPSDYLSSEERDGAKRDHRNDVLARLQDVSFHLFVSARLGILVLTYCDLPARAVPFPPSLSPAKGENNGFPCKCLLEPTSRIFALSRRIELSAKLFPPAIHRLLLRFDSASSHPPVGWQIHRRLCRGLIFNIQTRTFRDMSLVSSVLSLPGIPWKRLRVARGRKKTLPHCSRRNRGTRVRYCSDH